MRANMAYQQCPVAGDKVQADKGVTPQAVSFDSHPGVLHLWLIIHNGV